MNSPSPMSETQCATERLLIDTSSTPFDFEALWSEVELTCQSVLDWETSDTPLTTQSMCMAVTRAYILVYHLVSHPCHNTPRVNLEGRSIQEGQQSLAVYLKLRAVLQNHLRQKVLTKVESAGRGGRSVMEAYIRQWRSFLVAVTNLKTIFSALAPAWNSLGFEENPFERIEDIALNNWSEIILHPEIQEMLEVEIAASVGHERSRGETSCEGKYVTELKDVLAMLPDQSFYRTILERTYLTDLRRHFAERAGKLRSEGVYQYATEALKFIASESERACKYLKSKKLAIDQLVSILVDDNIDYFQTSAFADWMRDWKSPEAREKIYSVYNLLSRSRRVGLPLLEERFTSSVVDVASKEIRTAARAGGKDGYGDIIRAFLSVIKSLRDVVADAFHEDACMVEAMENGLRQGLLLGGKDFIDYKALAERLAALSCGAFVPTQARQPDQMTIEDIVCVYFFLPDYEPSAKEAFLVSYHKQLARRLLSGEYSPSLEQQALYLLVQVKQSPLLFACRTMVRAVTGGTIYEEVKTVDGVDWRPVAISKGTWPAVTAADVRVPAELQQAIEQAKASLEVKKVGRRVNLATPLSHGVVKMQLPAGSSPSFVHLKVNLQQISLINCLREKPQWVLEELCRAMGCSLSDAVVALVPFIGATIVACELPPRGASVVHLNSQLALPPDTTQLTLIPEVTQVDLLPAPGSSDALSAKVSTHPHPQAVETHVIRCLKTEGPKSLEGIQEYVGFALHPHPVPRIELKKALERLVERQFVSRDDVARVFRYLP